MITLRFEDGFIPAYKTEASAGADLISRVDQLIKPGTTALIPTGVWIDCIDWSAFPRNTVPELQVRARSSLAYKHSIILPNGVGTIDADYADEICVLLTNIGQSNFQVEKGMRIAQLVLALTYRIPNLPIGGQRNGGFGSTGLF